MYPSGDILVYVFFFLSYMKTCYLFGSSFLPQIGLVYYTYISCFLTTHFAFKLPIINYNVLYYFSLIHNFRNWWQKFSISSLATLELFIVTSFCRLNFNVLILSVILFISLIFSTIFILIYNLVPL